MRERLKVFLVLLLFAGSAFAYWPKEGKSRLRLGLDLQGGSELIYSVENVPEAERVSAADRTRQVIEARLERSLSGRGRFASFEVRTEADRVVVTLPGIDPALLAEVKRTIEQLGTLEFRFAISPNDRKKDDDAIYEEELARRGRGEPPRAGCHWYRMREERRGEQYLLVEDEPQPDGKRPLTGDYLDLANNKTFPAPDQQGQWSVHFSWNPEGAGMFSKVTGPNADTYEGANDGRLLAIILDERRDAEGRVSLQPTGEPYGILASAPRIRSEISESGVIEGDFSRKEAEDLVRVLGNSLRWPIRLESEVTIGPLLGDDTIRKGIYAAVGGLVAVFAFISIYYLASGWVTVFALLMNLSLTLALVALTEQTLTLPGIAGLILTVGMAVDSNVLIFERIREEISIGKGTLAAFEQGYNRAFSAIWDSHVTTVITSIILWSQGSGPVKGFGVTLTFGLIVSLFTSVYVTKVLLRILVDGGALRSFRMLQLVPVTSVPFSRFFRWGLLVSAVLIGVGILDIAKRGRGYFGIDFTGGSYVRVRLAGPMPTEELRSLVRDLRIAKGYEQTAASVVPYGAAGRDAQEFGITVQTGASRSTQEAQAELSKWAAELREALSSRLAPGPFPEGADRPIPRSLRLSAKFGPKTPVDQVRQALKAVSPTVEVSEVSRGARHAVLRVTGEDAKAADDLRKEIRLGSLRSAFLPDRIYAVGKDGDRVRYSVRFRDKADPADLEKRLAEKGHAGAKVSADADEAGRWIVELAGADATKAERDLDAASPLGGLFVEDEIVPAGIETTANLLLKLPREEIERRLKAIHPAIEVRHAEERDGVQRVTAYAKEETLAEIARGRRAAQMNLQLVLSEAFRREISDPFPSVTTRGAAVAAQTKQKAVWATMLSLAAIIIYVGFRFDFKSGFAAVVALAHDALVAVGALSLAGFEMDLEVVGAVLTIIGYSINDTIVIYDRLRENLRIRGKGDPLGAMDLALNQTLSRTLLTTGLTLLSAIAILVWGGDEVRPFAFTLVVGMVSGTYSTVFIACPLLGLMRAGEGRPEGRK